MMIRKFVFISAFLLLAVVMNGQKVMRNTSLLNYQRGDQTILHFGFTLGVNYMNYQAILSGSNPYRAEAGKLKMGYSVGMISELRLFDDLGLRFMPGLEFSSRTLIYNNIPDADEGKTYSYNESVYVTFPLMLKYKAKRINNFRPFLTAGSSLKYDFKKHQNIDPDQSVYFRTKPVDLFLETGVGSDFYLPYFKMGIELRFAFGLTDALVHKYDTKIPGYEKYTDTLKKLRAKMFSVCFHFE